MAISWMSWLIPIFVVEQRGRAQVFPFDETTELVCFEWASMMVFEGFCNPRCFPVPLHRLKGIVRNTRTTGSRAVSILTGQDTGSVAKFLSGPFHSILSFKNIGTSNRKAVHLKLILTRQLIMPLISVPN
jgi:hypothetical protein